MNNAIHTLRYLVTLRDTISLGIDTIVRGHSADDQASSRIISGVLDDIETAWDDFSQAVIPDTDISAGDILDMLGLDPVAESRPEKIRGGFTVISGGLS